MTNCKCDIPAKKLQVKKEGPNKDRFFYTCSKPREEQCDFFEWVKREIVEEKEPSLSVEIMFKQIQLALDEIKQDLSKRP